MTLLPGIPDLNREDLLLLLLILFLLGEKGKDNREILAGLAFLLLAGFREREKGKEAPAAPPFTGEGRLIPFGKEETRAPEGVSFDTAGKI